MQPLQVLDSWNPCRFARLSPVAFPTCQHQVPKPVKVCVDVATDKKSMREEVVNIGQVRTRRYDADFPKAIEAPSLLVAVQGVP